jgi:predicted phosphodiesterase
MTKKAAGRVLTYVVLADIHYPKTDTPTLNAIKDFLSKNKVDGLVYQGDQLDFESISHHTKGKPLYRLRNGFMNDVRGFDREVLTPIDALLKPECERVWIDGNHERFAADLVEEQPELEEVVDYKAILQLETRGYKCIPLGHCFKIGKLNVIHGEVLSGIGNQGGIFPSRKAVELYAGNVLAAHTHAMQLFTKISPVEHTQKWQGAVNAIVGKTNPSYLRNRPTAWSQGFAIVELHPNGNYNLYLVNIVNGIFSFGGILYGTKV